MSGYEIKKANGIINRNRILDELKRGPVTRGYLSTKLNITRATAGIHIRHLREMGIVYRCGHEDQTPNGVCAAIYALGDKPDAPRPPVKRPSKPKEKPRTPTEVIPVKDPYIWLSYGMPV